jgi:cytochrome c oxidase subunit 3
MHSYPYGGSLLSLGFFLTAFAMILWFRDVIMEGTYLGNHTKQVQAGLVLGFALFIVSEIMAFFSVF